MSQESTTPDLVERVQRIVAAMNAHDFAAAVCSYAPDAVLDTEAPGVHEGRPAIRSFYEDWWGAYEDQQQEAEEIRDLGDGVVVVVLLMRGRLRGTAGLLQQRYAAVATWADGLIEKQTNYLDIDEARAAADRLAEERRKAMSENLELVQAVFDAYFRGDERALLALTAADVLITQFPEQVDAGEYRGHDGFRQVMADWTGSWDDWSIELLSAREVGDLVLATARQRGRGKGSGAPMESEATFVFTVREGLISRWQMFSSEQQALKAVGLEE